MSSAAITSVVPDTALYGAGDQDDIVLQTFKQQQEAYRQLLAGMKVWEEHVPLYCMLHNAVSCAGKPEAVAFLSRRRSQSP